MENYTLGDILRSAIAENKITKHKHYYEKQTEMLVDAVKPQEKKESTCDDHVCIHCYGGN